MPAGRPTKLTPALIKEIGEAWLLAFTDEETAALCGITTRTIANWRKNPEFFQAIKREQFHRERFYRRKIINGQEGWQGAAWYEERTRPLQFAKPEIQLSVNTQTVNNTLVVVAEVAKEIHGRVKEADAKIERLLKDKRGGNGNGNSHPPEAKK